MRAAAIIVVASLLAGPLAGTRAQPLDYRQIVDLYRGAPNDGVARLLAMPPAERDRAVAQALADSGPGAWSWEELAAAALMHTDAGFYLLSEQQAALPQLAHAEALVSRALRAAPGRFAFARRWYGAVDAVLERFGDTTNAKSFAAHFQDRFKDAPQRGKALQAYRRGVFAEFDGCQKGEFLTIAGLTESGGNLVQRYFVPAARELGAAIDLDPELLEAALHLGRVRMLEGRHGEAAPLLARAARSQSPPVAYLAHLFLGSFAERASRWDEAETHYRGAVSLFPTGQSANVALAQLLDRRGGGAEAARLVAALLHRPAGTALDPWWLYFEEVGVEAGGQMALLRAEVIK